MTFIFLILFFLFVLMTAFPFLLSRFIPKESEPATLVVQNHNKKDPRYFANSFETIMEKALDHYETKQQEGEDRVLTLSHQEDFVYATELPNSYDVVDNIVVAPTSLTTNPEAVFKKEIFAKADATVSEGNTLRAIKANSLIIRSNCKILRWADGTESTYVGKNCQLGVSCSSQEKLSIEGDCQFQKLYAKEIHIGHFPNSQKDVTNTISPDQVIEDKLLRNAKEITENTTLDQTIITNHTLRVGAHSTIKGHIKSQRQIILGPGTTVYGNVIAEKGIILQEGCRVFGDIFSQTFICIDQKCVVGQAGKIKSMVARENIYLSEGCIAYGFIGCESHGHIINTEALKQQIKQNDRR